MPKETKIRVLYVQPGKYPEERVMEHTLAAMQTLVGGDIEAVYPWEDTATPGIAARIFPRQRAHPSWLPTAARCWSAAGTTATATKFCWITAQVFQRGMPI